MPPPRPASLFPDDRAEGLADDGSIIRLRLAELTLHNPRQWGACWLGLHLWVELHLDRFWSDRLPPSRKGTRWDHILLVLTLYRLLAPGSEWRLHRQWLDRTALADLLGTQADLGAIHALYACHDRLLAHKTALFSHLRDRWRDLFNPDFDVLLYDLTSTCFEANPPFPEADKRRFGYSRDKRSDCVQVVIALVITPDGLPLAYEVLAGNTADKTTLRDFLNRIETQHGKARRIWLMDRGIPTEAVLAEMREADPPVRYLVGTPKGRLTRLQQRLTDLDWQQARPGERVKLLPEDGELYVFALSQDRVLKERGMRRRRLKWLWARLRQLSGMELSHKELLMRLGAARAQAPTAWRLVDVEVADGAATFSYRLNRAKLRQVRLREGRYLLRINMAGDDPAVLWEYHRRLVEVEQVFKTLKGELAIRPIFHQREDRTEAHIFIAFLAFALHATLRQRLRALAPGMTPRAALETFEAMQMIDVRIPTTDGRALVMARYMEPEAPLRMLIERLRLRLPAQPPPRITPANASRGIPEW